MFQSLVITLREGAEAALIVGIVVGYLKKSGRESWNRWVYLGLFFAVLASLGAAYVVHRLEVSEDAYEGWLMLIGSVFVASMVIWMWKAGKHMKQDIEHKLGSLSENSTRLGAAGVFLFVFLMVFREGIETVLSLAAVELRTTALLNFMGSIIGLALAVGLGVAFFKGSLKVNLRKFFKVTGLVLLLVAGQLLITGLHELSEAEILPSSRREMALVGPIVNNEAFFFLVVIALILFLVLAQRIQEGGGATGFVQNLPPPERRKALAEMRRDKFWKMSAAGVSVLVMILIGSEFIYSRTAQAMSPPVHLSIVNREVEIPTSQLLDKKLHRYEVTYDDAKIRLIAILDSTGTVRAGLDACQICGAKGYYQDGRNVICRNCGSAIYIPTIGSGGGCNPIHIDYQVKGGDLIIPESALGAAAKVFR